MKTHTHTHTHSTAPMNTQQAQKRAKQIRAFLRAEKSTNETLITMARSGYYRPGSWLDRKLKERNLKP